MDHFLIYIVVSSLVTLLSVTFAYKQDEDELRLVDFGRNDFEVGIESAPVYAEQPMKTTNPVTAVVA